MNYKTVRKNATKQINTFFTKATRCLADVRSRNWLDDSYDYSTRTATETEVREFMAENYGCLSLTLEYNKDGSEKCVRVETNGWSSKTFYISFEPNCDVIPTETAEEIEKPKMSFEAVQEFLKAGFVSPLNHGGKQEQESEIEAVKKIERVKVRWSESRHFEADQILTLTEYNRLEWLTLADERKHGNIGYSKTSLVLFLSDGQQIEFRHDICVKERDLSKQWALWVDHCIEQSERKAAN
ncbi:hypothetical protein P7245_22240 [Vibrio parahaemolyticus]|nr:hypothetical protein [Vibrio parahaemolyticus]